MSDIDTKEQVKTEEQKKSLEQKIEELLNHPKALAPMGVGGKMLLEKLFKNFKEDMAQAFEDYTKDVARSHETYRTGTLEQMNAALQKIDKKYSAMYGDLINRFLVKMEGKVYAAELGVQAVLEQLGAHLHRTEMVGKTADDAGYVTLESYLEGFQKKIEARMEELAIELKQRAVERMKQKAEQENKNAEEAAKPAEEPVQEEAAQTPAEDGDRL
jgi:hypothetical protein